MIGLSRSIAMHRRDILALAAGAAPLIVAGRAFATPQNRTETQARLLVVFLRGAYDAASLLVPVSSDFYYASRPTIAIPRPSAGAPDPKNPNAAIPLTGEWGLHPALAPSILPLWRKGQVAFAPYAGTDDLTRSHFETQDTIELGQPIQGSRNYGSGFMNRLAGVLTGVQPIAFTQQVPLTFQGGRPVPNVAINGLGKPGVDDRQAKLISDMYQASPLGASVREGFAVDRQVYQTLSGEMAAASRGAVSAKGFELSARRIARLMQGQFNLAFLDVGGWDTHVNQGAATGYLAGRLAELGAGLAGYADEIGPEDWNHTVVVVISEFGRTFRENGNKGTDHGHGSVYWVMGGGVRGGRILGDHGPVTQASLNQNRDYPVLIDYRGLFGGLFRRMYGLDAGRLQTVFPSAAPRDLNLV
jgi:uncharacterized protein (DUF1501 family)